MKPSRAFWGTFFIVFGALFLVGKFYEFDLGWGYVWKFWPLAFVLIGLAVMIKDQRVKWILAACAAAGLALFAYGAASFAWIDSIHAADEDSEGFQVQEFSEPMTPGLAKATLRLDAAAGKFTVEPAQDKLFEANVRSSIGRYRLDRDSDDTGVIIRFKSEGNSHIAGFGRKLNRAELKLNTAPAWDMDINAGAADVDFDLSPFNVTYLRLESGAAAVRLRLGVPATETHCKLQAGVSSIKISVPESAGCEIRVDGGLSSKRFEDFRKEGDHIYRTANFDEAAKKIYINAETGVSSIRVIRY